jgi:hypothetical protein
VEARRQWIASLRQAAYVTIRWMEITAPKQEGCGLATPRDPYGTSSARSATTPWV